jgi:hypothetical protein
MEMHDGVDIDLLRDRLSFLEGAGAGDSADGF